MTTEEKGKRLGRKFHRRLNKFLSQHPTSKLPFRRKYTYGTEEFDSYVGVLLNEELILEAMN